MALPYTLSYDDYWTQILRNNNTDYSGQYKWDYSSNQYVLINPRKHGYDVDGSPFVEAMNTLGDKLGVSNTGSATSVWDDLTGKTNTDVQNTAASALQEDAQAHASAEAQKERDWLTEMSNTAYQRQVKDLQSAGLNPWLAVGQGGAATTSSAIGTAATSSAQASNVNMLASIGTAAAGIGILIKALKALK